MFVWVAISYQLQKPIHRTWMNMAHLSVIALNLATCVGDNVQCSQKLFNLGNPFLSRILIQKLLKYSVFFERVCLYIYIYHIFFSPFFLPSPNSPIDRTSTNVQTAGFHTCFRYGKIVVPMVCALALVVRSKILPPKKLPQLFANILTFCFGRRHPKG